MVEMLVVIAIIAILASLLLPVLAKARAKAVRVQCVAGLKQIGVGFHVFLHDHDSKLPMQVSTNSGGTLEFTRASYLVDGDFYFQYRHFQALSNDLRVPKILACPSDRTRLIASDFHDFDNQNISYFVGANADYNLPNSILAGDRNITNASVASGTIIRLANGTLVAWTGELHVFKGNVLYADGRVEQLNSSGLANSGYGTPSKMDLFLPTVKGPSATPASASSPSTPAYYPHYDPPTDLHSASSPQPNSGGSMQPASYALPSSSVSLSRTAATPAEEPSASGGTMGALPQKIVKSLPGSKTNADDEAPVIIASTQSSTQSGQSGGSWLLFLLFLLFLIIAAEMVRRRFGRDTDESGNSRPRT